MKNDCHGMIFDFNGVLLWDSHLHEKAWNDLSVLLRGFPFSPEEVFIHIHGRTNKYVLEYLLDRPISLEELSTLSSQKESLYQELCLQNRDDFQLSPGAMELLDFLMINTIPYTIATASNENNLQFFIEHLKLDNWFDVAKIVYDDGTFTGKLGMYIKAAENLQLRTEQCVVVEDAKAGIIAAHNAGIGKIIALGPADKHEVLRSLEGVGLVITSLEQIPKETLFCKY